MWHYWNKRLILTFSMWEIWLGTASKWIELRLQGSKPSNGWAGNWNSAENGPKSIWWLRAENVTKGKIENDKSRQMSKGYTFYNSRHWCSKGNGGKKNFHFSFVWKWIFFCLFSLLPALLAQSTQRGNWVLFACTDTIPFHDDVKLCKKG